MSRRKQARPSRANFEEDPLLGSRNNPLTTNDDQQPSTPQDENDTGSENEDTHVTGEEAVDLTSNRSSHHEEDDDEREASESPMDEDEEDDNNIDNIKNDAHNDPIDDDENSKKQIENLQDAENNNDGIFSLASGHTSHVTLEALQNTKVAVAQFAAKALAGCVDDSAKREFELVKSTLQELQDQQSRQIQLIDHLQQQLSITHKQSGDNIKEEGSDLTSVLSSPLGFLYPKSISSLTLNPLTIPSSLLLPTTITSPPTPSTTPTTTTMATNTLSSIGTAIPSSASVAATLAATIASRPLLHHHNMMTSSSCSTTSTSPVTVISAPSFTSHHDDSRSNSLSPVSLVLPTSTTTTTSAATTPISSSSSSSIIDTTAAVPTITTHNNNNNNPSNMLPSHPGLASISSSLASTIITNNDPLPLNEPNTLEMLQKRAQEVLDNASQGLLANNLADELAFRSGKSGSRLSPYDSKSSGGRGEPFFKHRCRYCGKVFGSDSALQIHIRSHTVRGNTTCNICYKTFACNSALEIHYRSHTKERPFKCTICDRGFSTKGNMKQHMLTHKIRDLPSHMYGDSKQVGQSPQSGNQEQQQQQQRSQELRDQRHHQDRESSHSPMEPDESSLPPPPPPPPLPPSASAPAVTQPSLPLPLPPPSSPMTPSSLHEQPMPIKRSPTEGDLPAPKRPSMSSKHLCHVCNKNFSSSSALQIHMRTHTGDKPFRCTVCQKAFTTKGNLKVHMGTHMWTNGASRRGRRMSLDLPPLPITPKDSEFLQRRPDLFYPYLPGPGFLNGVQQKLSEISVIQGNNGLPVNHPAAGKYAGLFGSLYGGGGGLNLSVGNGFPMDKGPLVPSNNSHDDGKPLVPSGSMLFHTPSPSHSPSTPSSNTGNQNSASIPPWNNETLQHHFERDGPSRDNDNESTSPPAPRLPPTSTTRGEGLAA